MFQHYFSCLGGILLAKITFRTFPCRNGELEVDYFVSYLCHRFLRSGNMLIYLVHSVLLRFLLNFNHKNLFVVLIGLVT